MPLRLIVRPAPALLHTLRSLAGTAQRQACGSALQAHHTPSSSSGGSAAKPPPLRCMVACSAGLPGTTSPAASSPAPQDAASNSGSEQDEDARLLSALAIPPAPGLCTLGARVEHVLAPREGLLSEVVTEALQLPQGAAELLLRFGAIHTCPVPPALPPAVLDALPPEEAAAAQARRQAALERFGRSSQACTPQRTTADGLVSQHAYLRVHLHPKRFPAVYAIDWAGRIVANTPEFVVVNKPAGVPAVSTVDNQLECAPTCAAEAVGHPEPLKSTHRLDQCTEGLLVLGKTKAFVARFHTLLKGGGSGGSGSASSDSKGSAGADGDVAAAAAAEGEADGAPRPVRKFYRAATAAAPPRGLLRHRLSVERRRLGLPTFTVAHEWGQAVEGSQEAQLRVVEVRQIRLGEAGARAWGLAPGAPAHECLIELLTGRTHQIRAQLSAAGCPLLGDSLYQPLACPELRQRLFAGEPCNSQPNSGGERLLEEPAGGIGLQACRLEVADACMGGSAEQPAVFEAGPPWWRG